MTNPNGTVSALEGTLEIAESASAEVLARTMPQMYEFIKNAIRAGRTPAQVDQYMSQKGLQKGNPVRDTCYLAALHFQKEMQAAQKPQMKNQKRGGDTCSEAPAP